MPWKDKNRASSYRRKKRRELKHRLIDGRICMDCGYADERALVFHHRIPEEKVEGIGVMLTWKEERVIAEAKKCDILCSNCHIIRHWG